MAGNQSHRCEGQQRSHNQGKRGRRPSKKAGGKEQRGALGA